MTFSAAIQSIYVTVYVLYSGNLVCLAAEYPLVAAALKIFGVERACHRHTHCLDIYTYTSGIYIHTYTLKIFGVERACHRHTHCLDIYIYLRHIYYIYTAAFHMRI